MERYDHSIVAWIKIPEEHKPLFYAALPGDRRVSTIEMFGGIAMMVGGHMAGGLWGEAACVRLEPREFAKALNKGAEPFDPMGKGRYMKDMVVLDRSVMKRKGALAKYLELALEFTATLPPKTKAASKKAASKKAASKKTAAIPRKKAG